MDSRSLITHLQQLGLLPEDDSTRRQIHALLHKHQSDVRSLARELLKTDFLTAYQANMLLTGKGRQLVIGPYVILERLGEGGMGQVFKARHRKLHRVVALKVIRPERVANPVAVERFFREVQAATRFTHPNIVRGYDADRTDTTYYFAMQYVRGTDLSAYVKLRGPLPIKQACQFLRHAALGLEHIHEHGMVHRDIKPGNLILALEQRPAQAASGGVAVRAVPATLQILDLGLARLAEDDDKDATGITREGIIMGTVDYMAPEQARDCREADIRSDIYSLGCTFYFALTAQVPFPGGTAFEKMLRHQLEEPAPPGKFRPDVPPALSAILGRMMAKDPARRFQTPAAVADAVTPLCDGSAPPPLDIPLAEEAEATLSDVASGEGETDEPLLIVDRSRLAYRRTSLGKVLLGWAVGASLAVAAIGLFVVLWLLKR
jgi:eukaryotic-like serine/threonine-protein kinase